MGADGSLVDGPLADRFLILPRFSLCRLPCPLLARFSRGSLLFGPLFLEGGHVGVGQAHYSDIAEHSDEVVQVNSGAFDMARSPIRGRQGVDKGGFELREGEGVVVGGGVDQVGDLLGAEEHVHDGVPIGQELGGEGGFTTADAGELLLGALLDFGGGLPVIGAEGFDVDLALPPEGEGVHPVCPFSEECPGV